MSLRKVVTGLSIVVAVAGLAAFGVYNYGAVKMGFDGAFDRMEAGAAGIYEVAAWRDEQRFRKERAASIEATRKKRRELDDLIFNACYEAKRVILARLKAPSTADFPSCGQFSVRANDARSVIIVTGYVDAQNSFGAKIRTDFMVSFAVSGNTWTISKVVM